VVKLWQRLPPFRMTSISWRVHSVLELAGGEISKCSIEVGDELELISNEVARVYTSVSLL